MTSQSPGICDGAASFLRPRCFSPSHHPLTPQAVLFLLGKPIVLPVDATHFVLPLNVGTDGAMAAVGLSQDLFDSVLLLMQKAGALNLDITGQLVRLGPAARGMWDMRVLGPSLGRPRRGQIVGGGAAQDLGPWVGCWKG